MPRAGLTRERVIEQAAAVADEAGLEHLTLAAVARRCGVSLPGLYKHVDGLEDVKRDVGLRAVRELTGMLADAAVGVSGYEALTEFARAYRAYARLHPGNYGAILQAPPPGDDEYAAVAANAVAVIASALKGYQLDGPALIHAVRILRAAFHGMVSLEAAGGFGLPDSVDVTYADLIGTLDTAFRSWGHGSLLRCRVIQASCTAVCAGSAPLRKGPSAPRRYRTPPDQPVRPGAQVSKTGTSSPQRFFLARW